MISQKTQNFSSGVQNKLPSEIIAQDAASDELNWIATDGRIELVGGRQAIGTQGVLGGIYAEIFAPKMNGTKVHFRKASSKIQYFDGTTWQDVITGLTATEDYTFATYLSVAGAYLIIGGADGLYKIATANPGSYKSMYVEGTNHYGKLIVNEQRTFLWDRRDVVPDQNALYLSKIDPQNGTVYTTVTNEVLALGDGATTTFSGFLATAGGGVVTVTIASPAVFTKASHGFVAGNTVVFNTTGALPTGITAGTTYYVIAAGLTANDFEVSTTPGGTAINTSGAQSGVHIVTKTGTQLNTLFFHGLQINTNPAGITGADNYVGAITGTGITGTINYATGAYSLTFAVAPAIATQIRASYQYDDSNNGGVTDFRFTTPTRIAGEGDIIPQEFGGEGIQNVFVFEGRYYSFKKTCVYELNLTDDDTNATNLVYRSDIGIPSFRAGISTDKGIVYMDTGNPDKPRLTLLQRNPIGNTLEPINLTPLFKWEDYDLSECLVSTWGENIIVSAQTSDVDFNNRLFVVNTVQKYSVDISYYGANTAAKNEGQLYIGDSLTDSVYNIFNGFDDLGDTIENYWESRNETFGGSNNSKSKGTSAEDYLKRYRYIVLHGLIDKDQQYEVFISFDDGGYTWMGTVRGDGTYVDITAPQTVGTNIVGNEPVGGGIVGIAYPYLLRLRIRTPKFRKKKYKFVAQSVGYVSILFYEDVDLLVFEQKIPARYRQKQHVSLDGTTVDNPTFVS